MAITDSTGRYGDGGEQNLCGKYVKNMIPQSLVLARSQSLPPSTTFRTHRAYNLYRFTSLVTFPPAVELCLLLFGM